jgi:hypothetical protein
MRAGVASQPMATPEPPAAWEDRILGYEPAVDPTQLLAHELNARRHPGAQRDALRESLGRVGWVDVVKVNQRTGKVVDGHARVEEAITAGATVPVLYVDLDEKEERFVLATLDPISAMADFDSDVLSELLETVDLGGLDGLASMLEDELIHATGPDDDLLDDYTPDPPDGDNTTEGQLVLSGLGASLIERWVTVREGYDTDARALEALLP